MTTLDLSHAATERASPVTFTSQVADSERRSVGIQKKIYAILALMTAVAVAATVLGVSGMRDYHVQVEEMSRASERALLGEQMDRLVTAVVMDSRGIYMSADRTEAEKFALPLLKSLAKLRQKTSEWWALSPPESRAKFDDARARVETFIGFRTELARLARESGTQQARIFGDNDANRTNRSQLNAALSGLVEQDSLNVARLGHELETFYRLRLWILIALCGVGCAVSVILAIVLFRRGVAKPLNEMVSAISTVAAGNLQIDVPGLHRHDEIGALGRALSTFKTTLLAQHARDRELELHRAEAEREGKKALLEMSEMLEADLESAVTEVLQLSSQSVMAGEQVASDTGEVKQKAQPTDVEDISEKESAFEETKKEMGADDEAADTGETNIDPVAQDRDIASEKVEEQQEEVVTDKEKDAE